MSKVHILTGDEGDNYTAVIHFDVPAGNNQAGLSWKAALIADGKNVTVLTNIEAPELAAIQTGDVCEFVASIRKVESSGGGDAAIGAIVDDLIVEEKKRLSRKYRHYGRTF